jgi:hypothetical protein
VPSFSFSNYNAIYVSQSFVQPISALPERNLRMAWPIPLWRIRTIATNVAWWDRGPRTDVGTFTRKLGIWHSKQRLHCPIHPYKRLIVNFSNNIQLFEGLSQAPSHCDVLACGEADKEKFCPSYVLSVNRGPPSDKVNVSDDKLDFFQKMTYPVRDSFFWNYPGNDCSWNCVVKFLSPMKPDGSTSVFTLIF